MQLDLNTILDILKVAVGLIYLYLEYNAKRGLWIASVIMPCIGMWLFFNKGLYADFAINIYYLLIAVYGWIVWSRGEKGGGAAQGRVAASSLQQQRNGAEQGSSLQKAPDQTEQKITHISPHEAIKIVCVWLGVWGLIAWILATFTDSTVVALDSLTTSMSIMGMWMLARKYIEQWLVWLVVDGIYVYLYYYKGIYFSGTLYMFYTVMAILGYRKWMKLAASEDKKTFLHPRN